MIKVNIQSNKQGYRRITINGHANYDDHGKDLVCAGVSTIIVGTYNTLEKLECLNQGKFIVKEGFADFQIDKPTRENQIILETLITTLVSIELSYKKFIQIKKEAKSR